MAYLGIDMIGISYSIEIQNIKSYIINFIYFFDDFPAEKPKPMIKPQSHMPPPPPEKSQPQEF